MLGARLLSERVADLHPLTSASKAVVASCFVVAFFLSWLAHTHTLETLISCAEVFSWGRDRQQKFRGLV